MSFLFPSVFWVGLPLVALPLVIHLLNLRRQHRVPWAAMDFLLESQERSKTWINLREMLLLLVRTAVIALLVLLLARPTTRSGWIGQLLNRRVHHLILLDDSYSTTDRWADTSAWQEALAAVGDLVQAASDQSTASVVTVLRFSEATEVDEDPRPAIFRRPLDTKSRQQLLSRMEASQVTDTAAQLLPALRRASDLANLQPTDQDLVIHVVSDFRRRDVEQIDAIQDVVEKLEQQAAKLQFVRTVRQPHDNLAVTYLAPTSGVRASGVEVWMQVAVENYGTTNTEDVVVDLEQDGTPLVAVSLGDVPAGETVERRFRTTFAGAGPHHLAAEIDADAIEVDNRRVYATLLPEAQKVLLVDGSPGKWESYYVGTALAPGGAAKSGWEPVIVGDDELSNAGELDSYAAVALLDVPRLSDENLVRLSDYVERGGGLFIALGESIDRSFYAKKGFAGGKGLVPAPPDLPTQWVEKARDGGAAMGALHVTDHPIFGVFRGDRNSMLALMRVNYYYSLAAGWQSVQTPNTRVIATLADKAPLVIEQKYGIGKVIMQLTKISPTEGTLGSWSNLGPNPAFVVLANELFGYLARGEGADQLLEVGDVLRLEIDGSQFAPVGSIQYIGEGTPFQATLGGDSSVDDLELTSSPLKRVGLHEVSLDYIGGGTEERYLAVNPSVGEGDLQLVANSTLRQKFASESFALRYADQISSDANVSASTWTELLLLAVMVALVAEQALAYVCSFHE